MRNLLAVTRRLVPKAGQETSLLDVALAEAGMGVASRLLTVDAASQTRLLVQVGGLFGEARRAPLKDSAPYEVPAEYSGFEVVRSGFVKTVPEDDEHDVTTYDFWKITDVDPAYEGGVIIAKPGKIAVPRHNERTIEIIEGIMQSKLDPELVAQLRGEPTPAMESGRADILVDRNDVHNLGQLIVDMEIKGV